MREAGKGDKRRPEDKKAFDSNYDAIFRKKADKAIQEITAMAKELYQPNKPKVYFTGEPVWDTKIFPGHEVAHVNAVDHYVWGKDKIRTSTVLNKFPDGSFETMNTLYVPVTQEQMGT